MLIDDTNSVFNDLGNTRVGAGHDAGVFKIDLQRMLIDEHHIHRHVWLHFDDGALFAVLGGHFQSKVGAREAAAADGDFLALDCGWIAVGVLDVDHVCAVCTGDRRHDGVCSGRGNDLVGSGKDGAVDINLLMHDCYAELTHLRLVILDERLETGLELCLSGQIQRSAEFIAFIKCDMVSLKGSNACGFHAARTAADNDNIFGCFRFDDPECVLLIRLRVHCA